MDNMFPYLRALKKFCKAYVVLPPFFGSLKDFVELIMAGAEGGRARGYKDLDDSEGLLPLSHIPVSCTPKTRCTSGMSSACAVFQKL